jgi:2-oxo-4-hydroxy-4-carboxy-5-ureidoimidazoline decarboxylase
MSGIPGAEPVGLERLNGLPAGPARREFLGCCSSARWAADLASGRPYASIAELLARADESVAALGSADLEEALAGHPRIGERPGTDGADGARASAVVTAGWSWQEQAGVQAADQGTIQALAAGNQAYEERFGHIYLVCATGRSGAELLALLRERLGHDPDTEWDMVRRELGKINQIRLRKLLEGAG